MVLTIIFQFYNRYNFFRVKESKLLLEFFIKFYLNIIYMLTNFKTKIFILIYYDFYALFINQRYTLKFSKKNLGELIILFLPIIYTYNYIPIAENRNWSAYFESFYNSKKLIDSDLAVKFYKILNPSQVKSHIVLDPTALSHEEWTQIFYFLNKNCIPYDATKAYNVVYAPDFSNAFIEAGRGYEIMAFDYSRYFHEFFIGGGGWLVTLFFVFYHILLIHILHYYYLIIKEIINVKDWKIVQDKTFVMYTYTSILLVPVWGVLIKLQVCEIFVEEMYIAFALIYIMLFLDFIVNGLDVLVKSTDIIPDPRQCQTVQFPTENTTEVGWAFENRFYFLGGNVLEFLTMLGLFLLFVTAGLDLLGLLPEATGEINNLNRAKGLYKSLWQLDNPYPDMRAPIIEGPLRKLSKKISQKIRATINPESEKKYQKELAGVYDNDDYGDDD